MVKPEKSYVYANHDGPPITIKTYKGNTNYKLKTDKAVKVAEIKQDEFWRHLGNIQNNKGETKLVDTEMYDGSMHEGVVSRVTKMIQTMRKRKGLNEGGTYRTLQSLIIPTILYPMKYANGNNDIIEKLEKQINQLLKEKCRVPNGVKYEYMHVHKDLGGLGIDTLENTIGYEKLKILMKGLNGKGTFGKLMAEAVERLQHYTQSNQNPLETGTNHVVDKNDMWLLTLSKWMEKNRITIKTEKREIFKMNCEGDMMIVDAMETISGKQIAWNWVQEHKLNKMSDTITPNGNERVILQQRKSVDPGYARINNEMAYKRRKMARWYSKVVGRKYMNGQTVTRYSVPKQQIQQAIYKYTHNKVAKVMRGGRYAATWKTDTIIEEGQCIKDQPRTRRVEKCRAQGKEPTYENLIVFDIPTHEVEDEIKAVDKMNQPDQCLQMYSDGSVKNMMKDGTYAWMVAKKNKKGTLIRSKIRAMGKEQVSSIECVRIHSYRAEAIGLLSGLMFLQHIKWVGKVEWHTDSQSVIDTWNNLQPNWEPDWYKQKERDVWVRLWKQKKHWKGRLKIYWVKAHADNLKRKSTEDEKGNQTVDALADQAYEKLMNKEIGQRGVIDQNTFTMEGAEVYIQGVRLNGNVGQQIKEQVQVEAAKRAARTKAPQWGVVQEEIEWKEMLRTCKNKTIADRRRLMLDMWDGR